MSARVSPGSGRHPRNPRVEDFIDCPQNARLLRFDQFDAPTETDQTRLSLEFRRNIFLVFKESLHNIAKHAQASRVEIEVRRVRNQLHLRIQDNGAGFSASGTQAGNGLKNLRLRMSQLGGTAEIRSEPGGGTEIRLSANIT